MTYMLRFFIILFLQCPSAICVNKMEFVSQLLHYKNIQMSRYFTCWNSKEVLQALKMNARNNILSNFLPSVHHINDNYIELQNNHSKFGYVLDTSCDKWEVVLEKSTKLKFVKQQNWFLLNENLSDVYSTLKDIKIRLDSKIYVAQRENDSYFMFEYYNPGFDSGGELTAVNTMNYTRGIFIAGNISWYDSRKNLSSLHFKVLLFLVRNVSSPLEYLEDRRNKHEDTFIKIYYSIFKHAVQIHHFKWTPEITTTFFASPPHDADEGLGKMLIEGARDLYVVAGLLTKSRIKFVEFLMSIYTYRSQFVYRKGGVFGRIESVVFKPFSNICWLCILLMTLILFCSLFFEIHFDLRLNDLFEELVTSATCMISVYCQQGIPLQCRYYGGRFLVFCFLIFSFLLSNYYTSSIVSSLINYQEQPLKTLGELINSKLKLGLENSSYLRTYFKTNRNLTTDLHLLNEQIFSNDSKTTFLSPYEGMSKVKDGGFAYHSQSTAAYKYLAQLFDDAEICETAEIPTLSDENVYIITPKYNQYNKLLTISYVKIAQVGLLKRQQNVWDVPKPQCRTNQFVQIGLEQAAPPLFILLAGIALAFMLLLLEKLCNREQRRNKRIHRTKCIK